MYSIKFKRINNYNISFNKYFIIYQKDWLNSDSKISYTYNNTIIINKNVETLFAIGPNE